MNKMENEEGMVTGSSKNGNSPLKHVKYVMRFPRIVVFVLIGQASLAFGSIKLDATHGPGS